jgi:hypothetical protein
VKRVIVIDKSYNPASDSTYYNYIGKVREKKININSHFIEKYISDLANKGRYASNHVNLLADNLLVLDERYVSCVVGGMMDRMIELEKTCLNKMARKYIIRFSLQDGLDWALKCLFDVSMPAFRRRLTERGEDYYQLSRGILTQSKYLLDNVYMSTFFGVSKRLDNALVDFGNYSKIQDVWGGEIDVEELGIKGSVASVFSVYVLRFIKGVLRKIIIEISPEMRKHSAVFCSEGICEILYGSDSQVSENLEVDCWGNVVNITSQCWAKNSYLRAESERSCYCVS